MLKWFMLLDTSEQQQRAIDAQKKLSVCFVWNEKVKDELDMLRFLPVITQRMKQFIMNESKRISNNMTGIACVWAVKWYSIILLTFSHSLNDL